MAQTKERVSRGKSFACSALFLGLLVVTFYFLLKDQEPRQLIGALQQASLPWLLVGIGCMIVFFCCEAWNIQRGLRLFGSPAPYRACVLYAITGFFFSSVTPSASGGQPMQVYAMYRDGHSPAHGALALLTEFFSFQFAAVSVALIGFFSFRQEILSLDGGVWLPFLVGASLNLAVVLVLAAAVFSQRALPVFWRWLMALAQKLFPHRATRWCSWGEAQIAGLHQCAASYRQEKKTLVKCFGTSFVQVLAYHSIPYWVSLALGLYGQLPREMIGLQAVLFLSVSSLPLPGAVGLSEGGFLLFFRHIFPTSLLSAGMVLSRIVSFYLFLLFAGLFLASRALCSVKKSHASRHCSTR